MAPEGLLLVVVSVAGGDVAQRAQKGGRLLASREQRVVGRHVFQVSAVDKEVGERLAGFRSVDYRVCSEGKPGAGIVVDKDAVAVVGGEPGHRYAHLRYARIARSVTVVLAVEHHQGVAVEPESVGAFAGSVEILRPAVGEGYPARPSWLTTPSASLRSVSPAASRNVTRPVTRSTRNVVDGVMNVTAAGSALQLTLSVDDSSTDDWEGG